MLKFSGIPYPITKTAQGYFPKQGDTRQIVSDVLQLLLTYPGERVMLPSFGTPLKALMFDVNDQTTAGKARQMIVASLKRWEPRIEVTQVTVTLGDEEDAKVSPDSDKVMSIRIKFVDPENVTSVQTLDLQVPLSSNVTMPKL
jgi:phage baseplate assembly protein W